MIEEAFSVTVRREREDVFRVLTDFECYLARWAKGPVSARRLSEGEGVGTRFTIVARVGPVKMSSPYEVKAWEPPGRCGGPGVAGPVVFDEECVLTRSACWRRMAARRNSTSALLRAREGRSAWRRAWSADS